MSPSHLLSALPPQSCDGSAPCNDVSAFSWPAFLIVAPVVLVILVGPFVAIRAIARDRRRAEEWYIPDQNGKDSLYVPPWRGWFMAVLFCLGYAICLRIGVLLLASSDERVRIAGMVVIGVVLICVALRVVVDLSRRRTNRAAVSRLAAKLERSPAPPGTAGSR